MWDFSNDVLTLSNINPTNIIPATSVISFSVTSVRNPMSTEAKSGIEIKTLASNGGSIDSALMSLQVSTPALIGSATTSSDNTTEVSEKTNFSITFSIPIEMDADWKFEIKFPSEITISSFTEINGYNLFGGKADLLPNSTVYSANNTVVVTNALSTYTNTNLNARVEFIDITNPLSIKPTDSFEIYLKTDTDFTIASITSGVTYTSTVGSMTDMSATPDGTLVGSSTSILFRFKPAHPIPVSSRLLITLPSETSIVAKDTASCLLSELSQIDSSATWSVSGRTITIFDPFTALFLQDGSKTVQFKIDDITMPGTTAPSSAGTFQSCYLSGGTWYDIDRSTQDSLLTSTVGALTSFNVAPTSLLAYSTTSYTFTLVPARDIPIGGTILITLPPEVTIPNPTFSANSWSVRRLLQSRRDLASSGLESSFSCSCTSSTILINEGFVLSSFAAGGTISFDIEGVRNPVSQEPTSSFSAKTQTSDSFAIDEITTGRLVIMTSVSPLQSVSLSSTSLVNGDTNNLTIEVNSPSDLVNGDILSLTFPSDITLPATVNWVGVTNLDASVSWSTSGNVVRATLDFLSDVILLAGNSFSLTLEGLGNPTTTAPSGNIVVAITNSNGFTVNNYLSDLKIITTTAATMTTASLTQSSNDASQDVDVTITVELVNDIPSNGMISIVYPSDVSVDDATLQSELIAPSAITALTELHTSSERRIQITDMFPAGASSGDTYTFILKNVKNTASASPTSSFEITTFVSATGQYRIDQVRSGLTMIANCDYPWETCSSSDTSSWNSCLTATPALFLQDNSWVEVWDEGKLPVGDICDDCNSNWVAWSTTDADICTKWGKTDFEFLSGTDWVGTCPDGTFGNNITNTWDVWDTTSAFWQTCSGNNYTCTSWLKSPTNYILYGTTWVSSCPTEESVYDSASDSWLPCDDNWRTCSGLTTTCTSWVSNMKLDMRDSTWQGTWESGKTIESGSNCLPCDGSCLTWEISQTTCTSWVTNLVVTIANTCEISWTNTNEVAVNGVCKTWDSSWSTCSGNESNCTGWNNPFVLSNSQCIEECPEQYEDQGGTWVLVGLKCPENFELSEDGDACIPTQITWDDGFELNSSGKWVPDGTGFVPFPFIFIMFCLMLVVIAGKIKDKIQCRFIANLIALFGLVEPALMLTLFISWIIIDKYLPAILAIVALVLHYLLNLTMLIWFKTITMKDAEFSRWILVYRKTRITLWILGGAWSFRLFKIFYAGLFGLDSCWARFENPNKALMRIQKILAILSLAVIYSLLWVASVMVLLDTKYGYQALITAIEAIFLFIVFIVLHILELIKDPNPCSEKEYVQIGMKKYGEDITMAGVPMNYNDSLREKEEKANIELRKQALDSILKSVQSFNKNGFFSDNGTMDSCKMDTKMRRAFSYKALPAIQEEDSDELSDDEVDYYYKPRRKRRFSIGTENQLEKYADKKFFTAIDDIRSGKYLPDNVYADSHPPRLLTEQDRYLNVERATQTDDSDLKLLWRLARTIPPFKLSDILGEFEMDPAGMFIIVRDDGRLKDKHGRLVNSRGYLIDEDGNVIHQNGKKR